MPLHDPAAPGFQQLQLRCSLHTLDNHIHAELAHETEGCPHNRIVSRNEANILCEGLSDLDPIRGISAQIVERRIATAKIVDRDAVARFCEDGAVGHYARATPS